MGTALLFKRKFSSNFSPIKNTDLLFFLACLNFFYFKYNPLLESFLLQFEATMVPLRVFCGKYVGLLVFFGLNKVFGREHIEF